MTFKFTLILILALSCKYVDTSSGQNLPPKIPKTAEVQKDDVLLKTKNSHNQLLGTLQKWLQSNNPMGESGYSEMLYNRSSSMIKETD